METRSSHNNTRSLSVFSLLAVRLIEHYQKRGGGSALFLVDCNFEPTCSEYTKLAIIRFGVFNGMRLGFARIARCNDRECVHRKLDLPPLEWRAPSMLNREVVAQSEEELRVQVRELSDTQKQEFYKVVNKKIKDPDTYAVLNFTFFLGIHHLYLARYLRWIIELTIAIIAIVMLFSDVTLAVGIFLLVAVVISETYDLFRSEVIVQDYNNVIMKKALEELMQPNRFR